MTEPPDSPAIETVGLTRRFGAITAVDRLSLRVERGESVALFGPNGAGKTTLMRILTLNLRPSEGSFTISGFDPRDEDLEIRRRIGVISHQSFLYDDLTARQNLEFFARLYGVSEPTARAEQLLTDVGLSTRADDPVRTFSRGMQQRVSLARALVHDPHVVLLDEPFTGLDPHAARTLRSMLDGLREKGRTVFLVTHNLARGLELTDRWLVLSRGRIVEEGRSAETDHAAFEGQYFRHAETRSPAGAAR